MWVANPRHLLAAILLVSLPSQLYAKLATHAVAGQDNGFFAKAVHRGSRQGKAILLPEIDEMQLVRVSTGSAVRSANEDPFHPPSVGQYLVRVNVPVRKDLAKELRRVAKGNVRYVPHHTFLVDIPASALSAVMEVDGVMEVFVHPSTLKIDQSLKAEATAEKSRRRSAATSAEAGESENVMIGALLMAGRTDRDPAQMASLWESSLKQFHVHLRAKKESANSINVFTTKEHLGEVAEWIAAQDHVDRVIWNNGGTPQDYFVDQVMQAGGLRRWTGTPVWDKGIKGQGQIITVSDTGIDAEHCNFYDPTGQTVEKCSGVLGYQAGCFNYNHRKIVSIQLSQRSFEQAAESQGFTDFYDYGSGHGTQCASLAAGSVLDGAGIDGIDNDHILTGVAPLAKMIILDASHNVNPPTYPPVLQFPSSHPDWYKHSYDGGSRVHSCSWVLTPEANAYGSITRSIDQFVYERPDYVLVYAAGNSGDSGFYSVREPSTAKNVLAIGNTGPPREGKFGTPVNGVDTLPKRYLTVNSDDWAVLAANVEQDLRLIKDWEFWTLGNNDQFFSFYHFFRDCGDPLQCGAEDPDVFFSADWVQKLSNRMEMQHEDWGGSLGDNEVLTTMLVAPTDHPCGCDLEAGQYQNGEVLVLHWDWHRSGLDYSMCNPERPLFVGMNRQNTAFFSQTAGCTIDVAWGRIVDSGASAVVLVGTSDIKFLDRNVPAEALDWSIPSSGTLANKAAQAPPVYQVKNKDGQVLFAAVAKQFFEKRTAFYNLDAVTLYCVYNYYDCPLVDDGTGSSVIKSDTTAYDQEKTLFYRYDHPFSYDNSGYSLGGLKQPTFELAGDWGDESLRIQLEQIEHSILAPGSSRGPTYDLRFKPDISCVGHPWSAKSDDTDTGPGTSTNGHCANPDAHLSDRANVLNTDGTSMATPNCAGGVALIQQYFKEGWHVSGTKNEAESHDASAALVKAMVINSGQPVLFFTGDYTKMVQGYPNHFTGFGFMSLGHVLMFDDSNFKLVFADIANDANGASPALTTGDFYETCFTVSSGEVPLVVSLAWTDRVGLAAAGRVLVNNLDLIVVSPTGEFYYGNHLTHAEYGSVNDNLNNLERVKLEGPVEEGEWSIRVVGTDIPDGPQGFALVGTGNIAASDVATCAARAEVFACENSCSTNGVCINGRCVCDVGFAGADCSIAIVELSSGQAVQATVKPTQTTYLWLDLSMYDSADLEVTVTVTSAPSITRSNPGATLDVQMTDCGYPGMDDISLSAYEVAQSTTQSATSTCGKWVIAVTGNADPRKILEADKASADFAVEFSTDAFGFTVQATVSNTAGTGSNCVIPPAGCVVATATPQEPQDPLDLANLPNPSYSACVQTLSWPEITALEASDPSKVKTGGLGTRMQEDKYEVWICLVDNACSVTGDPMCFVYDEAESIFKAWGKNSDLNIF